MRRNLLLGLVVLIWLLIASWQILEHQRVMEFSKRGLARRAHDLSAALSVIIRSQGHIAVVPKPRLEAALAELVNSTELESVVLLNETGEITASSGRPLSIDPTVLLQTHEHWTPTTASFANLVALGPGTEGTGGTAVILPLDITGREMHHRPQTGPYDTAWAEEFLQSPPFNDILDDEKKSTLLKMLREQPLTEEQVEELLSLLRGKDIDANRTETLKCMLLGRSLDNALLEDILLLLVVPRRQSPPPPNSEPWMGEGNHVRRRRPPDRPPWMSEEDYEQLVQERGVHWFLVTIPTNMLHSEMIRDWRLRGIVLVVALLACMAIALSWRSFERSTALAVQLVQARETANHLQELNVTAAGLVHETKNPLNLIRGFAQMISRENNLSTDIRNTSIKITEEADRVTGRLNQFLDYARPVEPRPKPLLLNKLVESIFAILKYDQEEKSVAFEVNETAIRVLADEDMLRQVLFNLILNAIQAVPDGGYVKITIKKENEKTACLEVRDNGTGVPETKYEDIFKPYFTMSEDGTGLGLAVVHQIALVHNWQVACMPAEKGAVFCISNIILA